MRFLIFYLVVLLIAGPLTWLTLRRVKRLHPAILTPVRIVAVCGSLIWLVFPMVMRQPSTGLTRIARALLAPPWFYWLLVTLLYAILTALLILLWLPFRKRVSLDSFSRRPSALFFILMTTATIVGFYQAIVPLRVERVDIVIADLPPDLEGYRLGVLSDLHVGMFTRHSRLQRIVRDTNALQPDVVLLTGDLVDDDAFWVPKLADGLSALRAPGLAVLGNHEIYGDPKPIVDNMKRTALRLLVNEGVRVRKGNATLWIAGLSDFAAEQRGQKAFLPDLTRSLAGRSANELTVLVAHQPKAFALARRARIPLTVVGHTHGGQCGFRPLGWSVAGIFLPYHMGRYEEEGCQLYINTGTGYWVLPFRLGMTPEITLLTLRRH